MASIQASTVGAVTPSSAVSALTVQGPLQVNLGTERKNSNFDPHHPPFLRGIEKNNDRPQDWNVVLTWIATLTFILPAISDISWFGQLLSLAAKFPDLYRHITRIEFPGFHWFSGVGGDRAHNPFCQIARNLPNLAHVAFSMHTVGITISRWSENQRLQMELTDFAASKERQVLSLVDIARHYELDALFECTSLQVLRIDYIRCSRTADSTVVGNPGAILEELKTYITQGFVTRGQQVQVDLVMLT